MRDLIIALVVFGSVPITLLRPWIGVLVWTWLGLMNPHMLTWGFARSFPFVVIVAVTTLLAYAFSKDSKRFPWQPMTIAWLAFVCWTFITLNFALNPDEAWIEWERFWRIQVQVAATMLIMRERTRLNWLVWVMALSIGFYGIKGGVFTLLTGGQNMLYGPGGFIAGNNELALAMIMILPLFYYLYTTVQHKWGRRAMLAFMCLIGLSVLASYSRGAFLGLAAMACVLWFRMKRRFAAGAVIVVAGLIFLAFLPDKWFERMSSIKDYQQDPSAMGRVNAWEFAVNLANDRPVVGGGFRAFTPELFQQYAPNPLDVHDAHSAYFEVLGEQGWVGLILYLVMGTALLVTAQSIIRRCRGDPEHGWAADLCSMVQVGFVGYAVCGAFLGLAYFDLPYLMMAVIVVANSLTRNAGQKSAQPTPAPGPDRPSYRRLAPAKSLGPSMPRRASK
jgi:probable O-glycosylation ligase (exosortase A-associated)